MKLKTFRIVVTESTLIKHSQAEVHRLESLVKTCTPEHVRASIWVDPTTGNRVIDGQAAYPMLVVLQALAKGEDLTKAIDKFVERRIE